jgi:hypothetical protein
MLKKGYSVGVAALLVYAWKTQANKFKSIVFWNKINSVIYLERFLPLFSDSWEIS